MSRLEAWETPFGSESWPSVWVNIERVLKNSLVFVNTEQLFKVEFENILGLRVSDESYDDNTRFHIERDQLDHCSYIWRDSPCLKEVNTEHAEGAEGGKLIHYVLLGGDYNVEILAIGDVEISPVTKTQNGM